MSNYSFDTLGLSEVRWTQTGTMDLQRGYYFIFSGNAVHRINGVGLLLSPRAKSALLSYNTISERFITVRFNSKFRRISIVQYYAPTEPDDDEAKDQFYSQLDSIVWCLPKGDIMLILGDFNAKEGASTGNLRGVCETIRQMSGNNIRPTATIKYENGAELTDPEHQLDRWRQFFSNGGSATRGIQSFTATQSVCRNPRRDTSTNPPSCDEIESVLKSLKNGKAAGPNNIPAELLRYGSEPIARELPPIIREAWYSNSFPIQWGRSSLSLTH
ncbi:Craniofacial development protein 2 [Lucilia cuprina]|nr:Craniofacial development protein 2 [Lucilia cuprina]